MLDRRSILKVFGVTAATGAVAAPVTLALAEQGRINPFELPFKPPDGMTYNWKRVFITGDEPDFQNIIDMLAYGWKPVPMKRHAKHYPKTQSYWIEVGGLVLMEKPTKDITPQRAFPTPWENTNAS
jgi:hypothetical protein